MSEPNTEAVRAAALKMLVALQVAEKAIALGHDGLDRTCPLCKALPVIRAAIKEATA
jgi:hypothetical protein